MTRSMIAIVLSRYGAADGWELRDTGVPTAGPALRRRTCWRLRLGSSPGADAAPAQGFALA